MASSAAAVLSVRCRMKVPAYIPARLSGIHGPACSGRVDVGHSKVLKTVDIMFSALYIYCWTNGDSALADSALIFVIFYLPEGAFCIRTNSFFKLMFIYVSLSACWHFLVYCNCVIHFQQIWQFSWQDLILLFLFLFTWCYHCRLFLLITTSATRFFTSAIEYVRFAVSCCELTDKTKKLVSSLILIYSFSNLYRLFSRCFRDSLYSVQSWLLQAVYWTLKTGSPTLWDIARCGSPN